jgi:hypothetical protein
MNITFSPKEDTPLISSQDFKEHMSRLGSGVGKTQIHKFIFADLKLKSPARAAYCISVFKRCGRVQLPRGCKF